MINKKLLTITLLLVCAGGIYMWWTSDKKVITRTTESLIECFEKEAGTGKISGAFSSSKFRDLLDDNVACRIERDNLPYAYLLDKTISKADLVGMHGGLINSSATIKTSNPEIKILSIEDNKSAVKLTLNVTTAKLPKNIDSQLKCQIKYKKIDGSWKVSEVIIK